MKSEPNMSLQENIALQYVSVKAGSAKLRRALTRPATASVTMLRARVRKLVIDRRDQDFLPAHLEILETPPSPLALAFTWSICGMFAAALIWSILAHIDIYATASGRIQLSGRSKIIQPFEVSKVKAIHVHNGDHVKEGELLVELDSSEAKSELAARESDLQALLAQIVRKKGTIDSIRSGDRSLELEFPRQIELAIRMRESAAMKAELQRYDAARQSLAAQIAEKKATQQRYSDSVIARTRLREVLDERARMRQVLVSRGAGTRAAVIDALQQVDQTNADIVMDQGQLLEANAAAVSLERKRDQLFSEEIAGQSQSISEISQKADVAFQDALRARVRCERLQLRAPIDGSVQQLAVTTQGQIVMGGQALAVVVPSSGPIEIEALILNDDIGFVSVGQSATVKIDSFPFTRYGTIRAKVIRVSRDGVDAQEANNASDALSVSQGRGINQKLGTTRTQNLVFPATLELDKHRINVDGQSVDLVPGMTTTVEVRTGRRAVIDYLLSPIRETTTTAGHER